MIRTGADLADARKALGLTYTELGRLLGMKGDDPGDRVSSIERGQKELTGPVAAAVALMLEVVDEHTEDEQKRLGTFAILARVLLT